MAQNWSGSPWLLPNRKPRTKLEHLSAGVRTVRTKLADLPPPVRLALLLTLLVLVTLLAGCETLPTLPSELPRNPNPPASKLPERSESWSTSVERDLQKWRGLLMQQPAKPSN